MKLLKNIQYIPQILFVQKLNGEKSTKGYKTLGLN